MCFELENIKCREVLMSFSSSLIMADAEKATEHWKGELSKNMLFRRQFSLLSSLPFGDTHIGPFAIPLGVPPFP